MIDNNADNNTPRSSPRPYWWPEAVPIDQLPENLRAAVEGLVQPIYEKMVVAARRGPEQSRGATIVSLLWLEVLQQTELAAGNIDLATKLQLVAAIGSLGATTILDAGSRAPANEGERLFRRKLALHLKYDRAMVMTEGPEYDFRFACHFSKLKMQKHRLEIQERELAEKCNEALRRQKPSQPRHLWRGCAGRRPMSRR
jgi:hypothetical protein